jgi:hypothetical protein
MRINYTPGPEGEKKTTQVLDFAENLFNLQHVEGFDDRVNQMRTGSIEAAFAEFDFARFLYVHDIDFKFVVPCGVAGKDYDFSIKYADGRQACADAKCLRQSSPTNCVDDLFRLSQRLEVAIERKFLTKGAARAIVTSAKKTLYGREQANWTYRNLASKLFQLTYWQSAWKCSWKRNGS